MSHFVFSMVRTCKIVELAIQHKEYVTVLMKLLEGGEQADDDSSMYSYLCGLD